MQRVRLLGARPWLGLALLVAPLARSEQTPVVINEIMYHPAEDLENLQYIELFNAGTSEVDLSGWSLSKGVKFVFPSNTRLASAAFLVVCRHRADFIERYGARPRVAGEFEGHLKHDHERIELCDQNKNVVDAVNYADSTPWPTAADGNASSLERICPFISRQDASNWAASKPRGRGAPNGTPGETNDSFSAHLPPVISAVTLIPATPAPDKPVIVNAHVSAAIGLKTVTLLFQVVASDQLSKETALPMKRISGDERSALYQATLPAQPEGRLVRYRIQAIDAMGTERAAPAPNDLRPAWSYSTFINIKSAELPSAYLLHPGSERQPREQPAFDSPTQKLVRGRDTFIYLPASGAPAQTFDFVQVPPRKGGFKVHFLREETLRGMTSINIIYEDSSRWLLAEPLAYELYRLAGVPAELTEHIRLNVDGEARGYHLLIEQPNKSFLARHHRNTNGNLYKLIWYGHDLVSKHEKKTNVRNGHGDLRDVVKGLNDTTGSEQWAFIEKHFHVDEFINYFAVNMCIQNWDGFHNNYFAYHDIADTGLWEIYPWDEDKTWGDYDGASGRYDWCELPLTFGMNGSEPPDSMRDRVRAGGFVMWWREPGFFSGPLLSNPQFRERFLARLRELCATVFTPEVMFPIIDSMEKRLANEIASTARTKGEDSAQATARFRSDMQSFRNQVINRRKFILAELDKKTADGHSHP